MTKFEVGLYNSEVRELVNQGKRHRNLTDDWADIHYFDIEAEDVTAAREKIARRYPADRGFVIESIDEHRY